MMLFEKEVCTIGVKPRTLVSTYDGGLGHMTLDTLGKATFSIRLSLSTPVRFDPAIANVA